MRGGKELLRCSFDVLWGWGRCLREFAPFAWGLGLLDILRRIIVDSRIIRSSFSFPCGLGLTLDMVYQVEEGLGSTIDIFPDELVCVGGCSSVAPSTTNKGLSVIFRVPWDLARREFGAEDGGGDDVCFTVDRC